MMLYGNNPFFLFFSFFFFWCHTFTGGSYFKCDHQRSVLLFLDSLNQTCASKVFPCDSYKDFLDGKCLDCERFGAAGCPVFGWYFDYLIAIKKKKKKPIISVFTPQNDVALWWTVRKRAFFMCKVDVSMCWLQTCAVLLGCYFCLQRLQCVVVVVGPDAAGFTLIQVMTWHSGKMSCWGSTRPKRTSPQIQTLHSAVSNRTLMIT